MSSQQCYAQPMNPQPPAGDPLWGGHDPGSGQIWGCFGADTGFVQHSMFVPAGQTPALINPAELAQTAFGEMHLEKPQMHLAPQPPLMTYVHLATWLWMGQNQYRNLSLTVSAGGTSVTVTAAPTEVDWSMGDGTTVPCPSAGRPWVDGMGDDATTDCSHTYEKVSDFAPNKRFRVTATIAYQVDWTCAGACLIQDGTLGLIDGPVGGAAIQVGERQSVLVNPPGGQS